MKEKVASRMPCFIAAVYSGNLPAVKAFIEYGASVNNHTDSCRRTGLHVSLSKGYNDIARLLIERGASPMAIDYWEHSPLDYAVPADNIEVARILIAAGADVSVARRYCFSLLSFIAKFGDPDVIGYVLDMGLDISSTGKTGKTPSRQP